MAGRLIGEAYIALLADADMFKPDADAKVKAAIRGMKATIPVDGDTGELDKKVAAAAARMKALRTTIPISGDTKNLIRDISGLYVALDGLRNKAHDIPLDLSNNGAMKSIFAVLGGIDAMEAKLEKVEEKGLEFNLNKAISQFYGMQAIIEDTALKAENMKADFEDTEAIAKLMGLGKFVDKLSTDLKSMRANVSTLAEHAQVAGMQAQAYKLAKTLAGMTASVDTLPFERDMLKLAAQAEAFSRKHIVEQVSTEIGAPLPGAGAIAAGMAHGPGWAGRAASMGTIAGMGLAQTASMWERLNNDFRTTGTVTRIASAGLARMAAGELMISGGATGWQAWTNKISLFGHALDRTLPSWSRAISMWHLGLDVLFEFAAAWTPAIIAVGTFAAYAAPVAEKIYGQWKNINTILDGVGSKTLPDLGKSFDVVQRAIEPQVLIAFGEYMQVIGKNAGPMAQALTGVGHVVDAWGAKLVMWASKATASFDRILKSGSHDFALIGFGFQQVFRIVGQIINDMPGIVHVLLPVGDAFLKITADAITFLKWPLKIALGLHGVIVYAGLAATAIIALGRAASVNALGTFLARTQGLAFTAEAGAGKFNKFGAALGVFAGNLAAGAVITGRYGKSLFNIARGAEDFGGKVGPAGVASKLFGGALSLVTKIPIAGWAGLAAVAIGVGLYFAFRHTTTAAEEFQKRMDALIASSSAANIHQNLQVAFQKTTDEIQKTTKAYTVQAAITKGVQENILHAAGASIPAYENQGRALNTYNATLHTTLGEAQNYSARISDLVPIFGSAAGAQAALNLAGIKAGDIAKESNSKWAEQLIELKGLAAGYGYMGQQVQAAGAQLNTLNIVSGTTFKNVQALQQAESQWVTTITSGENAFTSFEQGQNTLNSTLGVSGKNTATLTVRLGNLSQRYSAVGAKMSGTGAAALAARQAFDQQLTSATTLWGNLQMLSVASGNTSKSQAALAKSGKDIIAQLLPFAAGSKQATAEVSALAQVMGGPATDNFTTLAKWVGNTKGAEKDLNTQQANLTISASNLSVAAKNLGNALETGLANAEAAAIAKTFGLDQAISGLAANVQKSGHQVNGTAVSLAGEYVSALHKAGESTGQATQDLNAYLARLGYTPSQIKAIDSQLGDSAGKWNKYQAAVNHNAQAQKNFQKATAANGTAFKNFSTNLNLGSAAANALWRAITKQDSAMVANNGHAVNAKKVFADYAMNGLGLTASQANAVWAKFGHQNLDWLASHAGNAKKSFTDFAMNGLHLSASQAQALWKMFAEQQLDMMVAKGDKAKNKFIDFAMNGLGLSKSKANDLWNTLQHQYLDTVANKAGETKRAFEKTAAQFGITKGHADKLWDSLHKLAAGSPYGVNVNETLTGSGKLMAKVSGNSVVIAASGANSSSQSLISASNTVGKAAASLGHAHHAAGYLVPAGIAPSGQDGHPAMLAAGELVVPTSHVPAHLALAKQHGIPGAKDIPGLAAGGGFGNWAKVAGAAQGGPHIMAQGAIEATANGMAQFAANIARAFQAAQAAGGSINYKPGAGVGQWAPVVLRALAMLHEPSSLLRQVLYQISTESGGNPNAINLTDSNARAGNPSKGLLQATGTTFSAFHVPGTSNNIYDPLANVAAAIRYAISRYGPGLMSGGAGLGSGHGYFTGGMVNEPVIGTGLKSGMRYSFAERSPEYVGPLSGQGGASVHMQPMTNIQGQQTNHQLAIMIKLLQQLPVTMARAQAHGAGSGVRHGYYGSQA